MSGTVTVRGARRASGAPDPRAGASGPGVVPRPQPRTGRLGPVRLQQLVLVEAAAAVLLLAYVTEPWLLVPAAVVAAALVLVAVVRRRHRPALEWLLAAWGLARRRRSATGSPAAGVDPGFAPAVECDPSLRTYRWTGRGGREAGLVGDGTFLSAVLLVQSRDRPLRPGRTARPLPLDLLYGALEVDGIRLESVQVVQHTQPAPAPHLPGEALAARSYGPLQAGSGAPAVRLTWVALKLDPQLCAEAVRARGGGLAGAQRAVVRAADQLAARLAAAGFEATLLTEAELMSAVETASCANPRAGERAGRADVPARRTRETARTWRCDDRWHTTYWVARWPRLGPGATPAPNLVALLTSMPALASTFSLTVGRGPGGGAALTGHVRITGRSDGELTAARRQLERAARGVKVGLVRLDHEQVPGALATLPLGGTR
ncbi:type VII secretion protein EccE [Streptantibioticus cattleyicolor]|nr:type VII secretion protein EccE [Streptomyces sp. SID5468]MYS61340.1 type VII secretion protein EccE [Streptomyces sp. SID5468]CCB77190.1 conserved protein of unknown function [Streptantibioticus cattleyicolor NRRL 8057 = DSM 46488]